MSNKVIIGIPVKNDLESFKAMIDSLIHSTQAYDQIVIIESESTDGCAHFCDCLAKLYSSVEVIHAKTKTPLDAYNKLFDLALERKMDLLLTQTDVIFPKLYKRDWLEQMKDAAQKPECTLVTCINGGGVSGPEYLANFNWAGGWCTYVPLRTMGRIGGFDENFPYGWGVDIDYTYAATRYGVVYVINYWVDHHMMNEREHDKSEDSEKQMKASAKYFKEKWKDDLEGKKK